MRSFGILLFTCAVCLGANCVLAQAIDEPPLQFDPYNKHHDLHLGHNHVYPDRGAVFRDAPKGSITVNYAGLAYRFYNGVWFEPRGPAFIVVMPPIGVVVPSLPAFATAWKSSSGETYLYANEIYYLPRPDLGGYEVVNEPEGVSSPVRSAVPAAGAAAAIASSSALPVGTTAVATSGAPIARTRLASLGTTGNLAGGAGVASTQATSKVPGAPQTLGTPSEPEDNADAEIKTYSYAPDTAQSASKTTPASGAASHSNAAAATPGAGNWAVTEIRGTKTVPLTNASTSTTVPASAPTSSVAPAAPVASNSTVAIVPAAPNAAAPAPAVEGSAAFGTARPIANPTVAASSPTSGPNAGIVPAAAEAAAVGVAPALASNSTAAAAPAISGPTPGATPTEGPVHLAANTPSVATPPPPPPASPPANDSPAPNTNALNTAAVASAPPAPSTSTAPSVAPNATDAATPRPSTGYTYTSPPSASDYSPGGTVHTTTESPIAATVPTPSSAATLGTTQPTAAASSTSPGAIRFGAYPRSGQSPDQQARDQYDCYRFAVAQTGFDPMSGTAPAAGKPGQSEFDRARAACFEGRGYTLK